MTVRERIESNRNKVTGIEKKIAIREKKLLTADDYDQRCLGEEIRRLEREKAYVLKTIEELLPKLEEEKKKEEAYQKAVSVLKPFMDDVLAQWNSFDRNKREEVKKESYRLHEEFEEKERKGEIRKFSWYNQYRNMMRDRFGAKWEWLRGATDDEIDADNRKAIKRVVTELILRTEEKAGNVKDYTCLHVGPNGIEGYIEGDKGTVEVRSILAGGWNIQRLHVRVLVIPYRTNK